jgi:uncharacterized protein (DUF2267 family)
MAGSPTKERTRAAFFEHLCGKPPSGSAIDPNMAAPSVFVVFSDKLDRGEVDKGIERLPAELRDLWG